MGISSGKAIKAQHYSLSCLPLPVPRNRVDKYGIAVNFKPFHVKLQITEPAHSHYFLFAIVRLLLNLPECRELLTSYRGVRERSVVEKGWLIYEEILDSLVTR